MAFGIGMVVMAIVATSTTAGAASWTSQGASRAGAATRDVAGTMSGPGGFRFLGCDGVVSAIGSGTYEATGLGAGTYEFDVCINTSPFPIRFAGNIVFTTRNGGATLTGTIGGIFVGGPGPSFSVTVTGGTKRFAKTEGELVLGPFVKSNELNCTPALICFDWTDTARVTGTLRHVKRC
jgi:hypothetical protein